MYSLRRIKFYFLFIGSDPSNDVCTSIKRQYNGLLHIDLNDLDGGFGAVFFFETLNLLTYAEIFNLMPWVHFTQYGVVAEPPTDKAVFNVTFESLSIAYDDNSPILRSNSSLQIVFPNDGIWERYFMPVSIYKPNMNCNLPITRVEDFRYFHFISSWAVRAWQYTSNNVSLQPVMKYDDNWYMSNRLRGSMIINKYYKPLKKFEKLSSNVFKRLHHRANNVTYLLLGKNF